MTSRRPFWERQARGSASTWAPCRVQDSCGAAAGQGERLCFHMDAGPCGYAGKSAAEVRHTGAPTASGTKPRGRRECRAPGTLPGKGRALHILSEKSRETTESSGRTWPKQTDRGPDPEPPSTPCSRRAASGTSLHLCAGLTRGSHGHHWAQGPKGDPRVRRTAQSRPAWKELKLMRP